MGHRTFSRVFQVRPTWFPDASLLFDAGLLSDAGLLPKWLARRLGLPLPHQGRVGGGGLRRGVWRDGPLPRHGTTDFF